MEKIIEIIVHNWKLIAFGVLVCAEFVLFLVKKKPQKVVDGLYAALLKVLPGFVVYAEASNPGVEKGAEKLNMVIDLASAYIRKLYPGIEIDDEIIKFIKSSVEVILSTPQKKGE